MNLQGKIQEARDQGYSDSDIINFLSSDKALASKIQEARSNDYGDKEITDFLSQQEFKPSIEEKQPSLLQQIERSTLVQKASQYASGAIEGATSTPIMLGGAGMVVGGPVGGLIGAGIGLAGEIPHMIAPNYVPSPSGFIRSKLREYGITQQPTEDARIGRYVAENIGGAMGASGGQTANILRNVVMPAATSGLGGAAARELADNNPFAEFEGQ